MAKATSRPAKEIIDDALADNRWWEWLCYVLVALLVVTGISVLIIGIIQEKAAIAATGGGVTALFWPALSFARSFRRDNIRIRLYEIPLTMAKDDEAAARHLREAIGSLQTPLKKTPEGGA
jgi:hypothetical protein